MNTSQKSEFVISAEIACMGDPIQRIQQFGKSIYSKICRLRRTRIPQRLVKSFASLALCIFSLLFVMIHFETWVNPCRTGVITKRDNEFLHRSHFVLTELDRPASSAADGSILFVINSDQYHDWNLGHLIELIVRNSQQHRIKTFTTANPDPVPNWILERAYSKNSVTTLHATVNKEAWNSPRRDRSKHNSIIEDLGVAQGQRALWAVMTEVLPLDDNLYHLLNISLQQCMHNSQCNLRRTRHRPSITGKWEYVDEVLQSRLVVSLYHDDLFQSIRTGKHSVTYVSQLSTDRVAALFHTLGVWQGPMVVALYMESGDLHDFGQAVLHWMTWMREQQRSNLILFLVKPSGQFYPVNFLRNLVHKYVFTEYVFMVDADFVPSRTLEKSLTSTVSNAVPGSRTGWIVPVFEVHNETVLESIRQKSDVVEKFNKLIFPFHANLSVSYDPHIFTNYSRWMTTKSSYPIVADCYYRYEPYFVISKHYAPVLPEIFLHRGYNKVPYFMELCFQNFLFLVMPDDYLIHKPHRATGRAELFKVWKCAKDFYDLYVMETEKKFGQSRPK